MAIDSSTETSYSDSVLLTDKWHDEPCFGAFDASGNYLGESCSDIWAFVGIVNGERQEFTVFEGEFKEFLVGAKLKHHYSVGRLGLVHSDEWEKDG
jgi:hypothetical protein